MSNKIFPFVEQGDSIINMNQDKEDISLGCKDCHCTFVWTKGEQQFFEDLLKKGKIKSVVAPKRCGPCRIKYKAYKDSFKDYSDIT